MQESRFHHGVVRAVLFVGGEQVVRLVFEIPPPGVPTGLPSALLQDGEELVTAGIWRAEEAGFGGEVARFVPGGGDAAGSLEPRGWSPVSPAGEGAGERLEEVAELEQEEGERGAVLTVEEAAGDGVMGQSLVAGLSHRTEINYGAGVRA